MPGISNIFQHKAPVEVDASSTAAPSGDARGHGGSPRAVGWVHGDSGSHPSTSACPSHARGHCGDWRLQNWHPAPGHCGTSEMPGALRGGQPPLPLWPHTGSSSRSSLILMVTKSSTRWESRWEPTLRVPRGLQSDSPNARPCHCCLALSHGAAPPAPGFSLKLKPLRARELGKTPGMGRAGLAWQDQQLLRGPAADANQKAGNLTAGASASTPRECQGRPRCQRRLPALLASPGERGSSNATWTMGPQTLSTLQPTASSRRAHRWGRIEPSQATRRTPAPNTRALRPAPSPTRPSCLYEHQLRIPVGYF
ncbi:uncharacterized protein LOC129734164 [Falco cherrug]|uniref:uncharacterized protein LOC129734164 n=1 Tax=Falco cherrug TaxID=345164 RepID=UPI0024789FE7|nr:uncharacterized protein LOC129734164 [Falco cherrug]